MDSSEYGVVRILGDKNLCIKIYDNAPERRSYDPVPKVIKSLIKCPVPGLCRVISQGTLEFNGRHKNFYLIMKTYDGIKGTIDKFGKLSHDELLPEIKKFIDVFVELKDIGYVHVDSKVDNFCIDPETNLPVLVDLQALKVYSVRGFMSQVKLFLYSLSFVIPRETSKLLESRFLLYHPDLIERLTQSDPPKITYEEYSLLPEFIRDAHERSFFQRLLNSPKHKDNLPGVVEYKMRVLNMSNAFRDLESFILANPPPGGFYLEPEIKKYVYK